MAIVIDGRYTIIKQLGEGGMGAVYLAEDERLGRQVAVKRLRVVGASPAMYAQFTERFQREARAMARMQHSSIIHIHDYGIDGDGAYLVMEYLPNGTLKERMDGAMPLEQAVQYLLPVTEALAYLHQRSLIHRDIKPANILFDENDHPMLADFGIVKLMEGSDGATLTATGATVGTPAYMAPELIGGEASAQSDQYALGVILYELLTGKKPFEGRTPFETLTMQKYEPLPDPRRYIADLPEAVCAGLRTALAKEPGLRYPSMADFRTALVGLTDLKPAPAYPPAAVTDDATQLEAAEGDTFAAVLNPPPSTLAEPRVLSLSKEVEAGSAANNPPRQPFGDARGRLKWLVWAGIGVIVLGITFGLGSKLVSLGTEAMLATATKTATATATHTPTMTATMTTTSTPTKTNTPTVTPLPTLEVGSMKVREADGMRMVYVPEGVFTMGSEDFSDAKPVHEVRLDAYWIDQYEVTNGQYEQCVNASACTQPAFVKSYTRSSYYGNAEYADYPVIYVDWNQAQAYCAWAGGSLPTEAQWEKAARRMDWRTYPWGEASPRCTLANFDPGNDCVGDTSEVGSYLRGASPYGAMDMAGNVWEWVADWYDSGYYVNSPLENPIGPAGGTYRVLRGGSWLDNEYNVRSSYRSGDNPLNRWNFYGFRCAASP